MPHVPDACARLIPQIYDVALGLRTMEEAMGDFARIGGTDRAGIAMALPDGRKAIGAVAGVDAMLVESYNRDFHRLDTIVPRSGAESVVFIPRTTAAEAIYPGYEGSALYNEWARPHGVDRIAFATGTAGGGARASLVLIAGSDHRRFGGPAQLLALRLVAPHVWRSLRLARRLGAGRTAEATFLDTIERAPGGALLLDGMGRVVHVTRKARDLLAAAEGLSLGPRGLQARQPAVQGRIEAMIAAALRLRAGEAGGPLDTLGPVAAPRSGGRPPLLLRAVALPRDPRDAGLRDLLDGAGAHAVMVTLDDPSRAPAPSAATLRRAFGLTPAEAEVALRLFEGAPLARIAQERGVGLTTVRTHLLRAFDKTGVHRQADLARLLAGLARAE